MTFNFINKYPSIKRWLVKQIGYYSKKIYSFNVEHSESIQLSVAQNKECRVIVVAKCHYTESWQSFSSINKSELNKIITLKKAVEPSVGVIFKTYKNDAIDGFDVKTIKIDQNIIDELGTARVYIPETEIFLTEQSNQLLQLDTPAGSVFCSQVENKVKTSYAKGIVTNINTYKLSVGISEHIEVQTVTADNFAKFIINQLFKLTHSQLSKAITFDIKTWFKYGQLHMLYWAPLLTALSFYAITNTYLYINTYNLEAEIANKGDAVSSVIAEKSALDNNTMALSVLSSEFTQKPFVHNHWTLIDELLTADMTITRMSFRDNTLVIRGLAEKASDVLAEISDNENISSAAFEGPVRKSRGQDSFILSIQLKGV